MDRKKKKKLKISFKKLFNKFNIDKVIIIVV